MIAKYLVAGVAASALMASVAFAQTPTTTTDRADMPAASGMSFQGGWRASKVPGWLARIEGDRPQDLQ
jgi:hypothetical protein